MENKISQYSIGEILDGRYFYIPAYQRGYRWTEKQVGDLLRDLLCFANDEKGKYDFYCLQPIIAKPISDADKLKKLFKGISVEELKSKGVWEIIDGQQRLTTIFLLYKYLLDEKGWTPEKLKEEEGGKELYHLCYETRDGSGKFLESLSMDKISNTSDSDLNKNIDYFHMGNAFKYIKSWIAEDGRNINERYNLGPSLDKIRASLFGLLNGMSNTQGGSVQVLWYELAEDKSNSSIKEFQKINTGKIRLTDAELIKGLFLLNKNFEQSTKYIKQSSLAIEWEFIENTLHADNFWYFLQKQGTEMPNRIDLIFSLIYKKNNLAGIEESQYDLKLKELDKDIADTKKSVIFRYYYDLFEGKQGEDLQKAISDAWKEVMTVFRTLDDWFCTPVIYNTIGLLSQFGEDVSRHVMYYNSMPDSATQDDFISYLNNRVRYALKGVKRDEKRNIITPYKDRKNIYRILLTLNIHLLNLQNDKFQSESDVYKFPFDVLNSQQWDIEHIDSFHTNALKSDNDKISWIKTAREDREEFLSEQEKSDLSKYEAEKNYAGAIELLKKNAGESDVEDDIKNGIGNLTLLDSATNRSYGNSLFCRKRNIIIDRIKKGVFVPIATQYIFSKFYDDKGTNRSIWSQDDMEAYQKYICDILNDFLPN